MGARRELDALRGRPSPAQTRLGSLIELVGETGSGKSRLLAEAGRLAHGMVALRAACEVYTRDTPYHAWRDLLRRLLGVAADEPDERGARPAQRRDRVRAIRSCCRGCR